MTIIGDPNPQFNRESMSFGPTSGEYGARVEGPKDAVKAMIPALIAAGATGNYNCDASPIATLEYSFPSIAGSPGDPGSAEAPTLVWELFANEVEKDILEADIAITNQLTQAEKKTLRSAINGTVLETTEENQLSVNAAVLYYEILDGIRAIRLLAPTLRVSKVVSSAYTVKASLTNVGRLITTATLGIQESIPNSILFNIPSFTTLKTDRVYAWYKKFPNVNISGASRFSIGQEWEYGLWSTVLYGTAL